MAAPELLGETTLKRFEAGLRKIIRLIPMLVSMAIILTFSIGMATNGILQGIRANEEGGVSEEDIIQYFIFVGTVFLIYAVFLFFYKKLNRWLDQRIALPLTNKLVHNNETRKNALLIGAILFTTGFLLQLVAVVIG